ncbi:hypothetical protein [Enterococcus sp. AZ102]|uniref:hypothetical protein n=1 Tax=Enterococcus sp. AZ102 TaxID=2774865 RepID=UPI003F201043
MVVGIIPKRNNAKPSTVQPHEYESDTEFYKRLKREDVSFNLNGKVPMLYIKGIEVGVVSVNLNYVTDSNVSGTNIITFVYLNKNVEQIGHRIISINLNTNEVFEQ